MKFLIKLLALLAMLYALLGAVLPASAGPVYFASVGVADGGIVVPNGPILNDPLRTFVTSEVEYIDEDHYRYTNSIEFAGGDTTENRMSSPAVPAFTLKRFVVELSRSISPGDVFNISPFGEVGEWSNVAGDLYGLGFAVNTTVSGFSFSYIGGKPIWGSFFFEGLNAEGDFEDARNAAYGDEVTDPFDGPQPFGMILVAGEPAPPFPEEENAVPEPGTLALLVPGLGSMFLIRRRKAVKQLA